MIGKNILVFVLVFLLIGIGFVSAQNSYTDSAYSSSSSASFITRQVQPDFQRYYQSEGRLQTYFPILKDRDACFARQDVLLTISPAGCQPSVVRSDLLAEQNVPVFCQIDALNVNPLIDVREIRRIGFSGDYPENVVGVGFHPAQAALRTRDKLLGSPLLDNIGYVVVVLKKNPNEDELPDFVEFTLQARLEYDSGNALGIGRTDFLLSEQTEDEWRREGRNRQSFFDGQFALRLEDVEPDFATVSVYQGDRVISTRTIERGKASGDLFVPGAYCQASLQLHYDGFVSADRVAKIQVNDDVLDVYDGSSFLNGKCVVRNVEGGSLNGSIDLSCGRHRFSLGLGYKILEVRDLVLKINTDDRGTYEIVDVRVNKTNTNYVIRKIGSDSGATEIVGEEEIRPINLEEKLYNAVYDPETEEYFEKSINEYKDLVDLYPNTRKVNTGDTEGIRTYGEDSLIRAIKLAQDFDKQIVEAQLLDLFIDTYPNSEKRYNYERELSRLYRVDPALSGTVIDLDNRFHNIKLLDVNIPKKVSGANFVVSGGSEGVRVDLEEEVRLDEKDKDFVISKIRLDDVIDADTVRITPVCKVGNDRVDRRGASISLNLGDRFVEICETERIRVTNIDIESLARIRIIPELRTQGETNLTVGIGIEKRAVKLAPDKTKERIDELDEKVKRWESVSDNLGKLVKGLKGACFATAGVLTAKNFLTGSSGEALARQKVMRGPGGWSDWCKDHLTSNNPSGGESFGSLTQCYNAKAPDINKDVRTYTKALSLSNTDVKGVENNHKSTASPGSIFGGESVNREKAFPEFVDDVLLEKYKGRTIEIDGEQILVEDLINSDSYKNNIANYKQPVDVYTNLLILDGQAGEVSPILKKRAEENLENIGRDIRDNREFWLLSTSSNELSSSGYARLSDTQHLLKGHTFYGDVVEVKKGSSVDMAFVNKEVTHTSSLRLPSRVSGTDAPVGRQYSFGTGIYAAGVKQLPGKAGFQVVDVVKVNENGDVLESSINLERFREAYGIDVIKSEDSIELNNRWINAEVQYYEREPYKGYPAIVPVEPQNGWYAVTEQTLPFGGGTKVFEDNGRPVVFWLCNVGGNKKPDFLGGVGDDICRQFNFNTGQPLDKFPGLNDQQTKRLVDKAVRNLKQASEQHGKNRVLLDGESYSVGSPAASITASQCQDFMSPEDCLLMFNVCDPVICPTSRCDFGGKYPVNDVIQTGVVGSTLLCLPNIEEKIAIPVCLTGIQAGIDGYKTILESYQLCLEESLETGNQIGICDEINSIYTCDFFWRQAAPLADVLLPKAVEFATGNTAPHGGGEYLFVQGAWDNAQDSVDFFTQNYAGNSIEAFKVRSTQEVGSQFCKAYVSANVPTSFENLIEPDSPVQFHALFSSFSQTEATVPATAQYKVFYHIFAGNDRGASYSIYLKDPPQSSFYQSTPTIFVASGYAPRGEFVTETKDFTAPIGYKQLCVRINNREECGFKQVSSSFALNAIRDEFVSNELTREDIRTQNECISGSANPAAFLNPNLGAAAQEGFDPAIYDRGIVRICSTDNPGKNTEPERFTRVGNCGNEAIGCWLDGSSIDRALTQNNVGARAEAVDELQIIANKNLEATGAKEGYLIGDKAGKEIGDLSVEKTVIIGTDTNLKTKDKVNLDAAKSFEERAKGILMDQLYLNKDKASLKLIIGGFYDGLARIFKGVVKANEPGDDQLETGVPGSGIEGPPAPTDTDGSSDTGKIVVGGYAIVGEEILFNNKETGITIENNREIYYTDVVSKIPVGIVEDNKVRIFQGVGMFDHLAVIDGALLNGDRLDVCKIDYFVDGKKVERGEEVRFGFDGFFLKGENCKDNAEIDIVFESTGGFENDQIRSTRYGEIKDEGYLIRFSSQPDSGQFKFSFGTIKAEIRNLGVVVDFVESNLIKAEDGSFGLI